MATKTVTENLNCGLTRQIIIPVESQIRELDAKLLLACVAARRGWPVVIGRLKTINSRITSFPRSIYISKGIGPGFIQTFHILQGLGHTITGWDEEALVHLPAETYFAKRISVETSHYVSLLFAWGRENADLWRSSPINSAIPIHVTGNPRLDLLRPEMRSFFKNETEERRSVYGDFFLINTNFSMVNSNRSLFVAGQGQDNPRLLGPAAHGMTREFAEQMERHKLDILEQFQEMIPRLARAFPNINIVIRPHPSENPLIYHRIAANCQRVQVVVEGNIIPWLLAAKAIIHNGCTTAIEASLAGVPAVSYGPTSGKGREFGRAWRLPDLLSHHGEDFASLREKLEKIVSGELGCFKGAERDKLLSEFLIPPDGKLACEQIVSVLEEYRHDLPKLTFYGRLSGLLRAYGFRCKTAVTKVLKRKPRKAPEARRAVYQDLSPEQLQDRLDEFQRVLGNPADLEITKLGRFVYRIVRS